MKHSFPVLVLIGLLTSSLYAAEPLPADSSGAIWIGINLTTQMQLENGRYLFVCIDPATGEVTTTLIDMEGGPVPPPPPPIDLQKQIEELLGKVTDTEKAVTAGEIAQLYDILIEHVDAGTMTDVETVRKAAGSVTIVLGLLGKGDEWKPFTDGMTRLMSGCTAIDKCKQVLVVATEQLRKVE